MTPYRRSAERDSKDPDAPPKALVYGAIDHGSMTTAGAWLSFFGAPVLAAIVLAELVHPIAGAAGGAGAFAFAWRRRRIAKARGTEGATLEVRDGILRIERRHTDEAARFRLEDVAAVELELKKVEQLQEAGPIPGLRLANATVAPEVDRARIVVVSKNGPRVALTQDYFANVETVEWLGKIRVFLRKHGWVPADEAPEVEEEEDDDE